jgi:16S rRNA G1207 methylase RsmC
VSSHYFDESPGGEFKPKEITVSLAGQRVQVLTAGSVFSPDHIDQGTAVLLEHLSIATPTGTFLDVGCGWGPIALALALNSPKATIYAIDVNERSLDLTRRNSEKLGLTNVIVCKPEDVPADVFFDQVWSNPPIRVGKTALHEILQLWINRLSTDSSAYLVVQKNLGSDSLQKWLVAEFGSDFTTTRIDAAKSFRVLKVARN